MSRIAGGAYMSIRVRELPGRRDLLLLAAAAPHRYPALLESVARGPQRARYDILFAFPGEEVRLDRDGHVRDAGGNVLGTLVPGCARCGLARRAHRTGETMRCRFRGGWLLYLGYELAGRSNRNCACRALAQTLLPVALALRCPAAIIVDHLRASTLLVAESDREDLLDALAIDLADATAVGASAVDDVVRRGRCTSALSSTASRAYMNIFARATCSRSTCRANGASTAHDEPAPASVHAALREANPAPFAGLLQRDGWAIASSSPERLIEVRGDLAQTRPIAGTRPRASGDDDIERVRELIGHPKERAEHVMLIDLERNDLGRVCVPGSVVVDELMSVETYAHVHHIVSNVRGRLRPEATPGRIVRAVFPGGTITGCPKVRCMEIIAELEAVGRGAYTGSLGYLNRDGDLDLNILIRTLTIERASIRFRAGAGIVADSIAERELEETRAKARGLLRALGVEQ